MLDYLFIREEGEYFKLNFSEIIYLESVKNYVRIITASQRRLILVTMKHVEDVLPKNLFCRIHRSYIVSLNYIKSFNSGHVCLPGKNLPISEQYRKELLERVITLEGEPRTKTNEDAERSVSETELSANKMT